MGKKEFTVESVH